MKLYHQVGFLLLFALFADQSSSEPISDLDLVSSDPPNGSNSRNTTGSKGTVRNQTSNLFHRLGGPRDRIVNFIKPAVKSNFSRNVTSALNSLWGRVQSTNSSIIKYPLVRNSIVIPINTTLSKLSEITAEEKEQAQLNETLSNSSDVSDVDSKMAVPLVKQDERNEQADKHASEFNEPSSPLESESPVDQPEQIHDEVHNNDARANDKKPIDLSTDAEQPKRIVENSSESSVRIDRHVNYKRESRFDNRDYNSYTTSNRPREWRELRDALDRIRKQGQRECIASALCQIDCRSRLFREQSNLNRLRNMLDAISRPDGTSHGDFDYYLAARKLGRQNYNSLDIKQCEVCKTRYLCSENNHDSMLIEYI